MNITVEPTPQHASGSKPSSRSRLRLLVAALVLVTTVATSALPATASLIGGQGGPTPWPGWVSATATCRVQGINIAPEVSVQTGYTNGQYVQWRFHLSNNRGYSGTSGWSGHTLVPFNNYLRSTLAGADFTAALNTTWQISVQVRYWYSSGSGWTYADTKWVPATYWVPSGWGTGYTTTACYT